MAASQLPGPVCRLLDALEIDSGTLCRHTTPIPGPVAAVKKTRVITSSANSGVAHVLSAAETYIGSTAYANALGNYECAAFTQHKLVAGAPNSSQWKPGAHVEAGAAIAKGTWVATFVNGMYQGHVGVFDSMDKDGNLTLIDQWRPRNRVDRTTYHVKKQPYEGKISNDPSKYYVVLW